MEILARLESKTLSEFPNDLQDQSKHWSIPQHVMATIIVSSLTGVLRLILHFGFPLFLILATVFCFGAVLSKEYTSAVMWLLLDLYLLHLFTKDLQYKWLTKPKSVLRPGLYYKETKRNIGIAKKFSGREENKYKPTWWLYNGSMRTFYPFIRYRVAEKEYVRRWLPTPDGEYLALDWAFPTQLAKNPSVYVILHGLNGGSQARYVLDFVHDVVARGDIAVVMIARGMAMTPIVTGELFHGARVCDLALTVDTVRVVVGDEMPMFTVGYSMGGIVMTNYLAKCHEQAQRAGVKAGVSISGCMDTTANLSFIESQILWQPMLAYEMKINMLLPRLQWMQDSSGRLETIFKHHCAKNQNSISNSNSNRQQDLKNAALNSRTGVISLDDVFRAPDVFAFDRTFAVTRWQYKDLHDYYEDMSAGCREKWRNISVPLLCFHADDDPVIHVDTMKEAWCRENPNIFLYVTDGGGHVGWPVGPFPGRGRWSYIYTVTQDFCHTALHADHDDNDNHTIDNTSDLTANTSTTTIPPHTPTTSPPTPAHLSNRKQKNKPSRKAE